MRFFLNHRAGGLDLLTGAGEVAGPAAHGELRQACALFRAAAKVRGKCHEVLKELGLVRRDRSECTICKFYHKSLVKYK